MHYYLFWLSNDFRLPNIFYQKLSHFIARPHNKMYDCCPFCIAYSITHDLLCHCPFLACSFAIACFLNCHLHAFLMLECLHTTIRIPFAMLIHFISMIVPDVSCTLSFCLSFITHVESILSLSFADVCPLFAPIHFCLYQSSFLILL